MASLAPAALYGLEVEPGEEPVPAVDLDHYPATFRITMAAIDPTQAPVPDGNAFNGATLKMIVLPPLFDEDEDDDEDELDDEDLNDNLMKILNGADSDSEGDDDDDEEEDEDDEDEEDDDESDSDDDEEVNGGPSDPEKSPRALKRKQAMKIIEDSIANHKDDDDDIDMEGLLNGTLKKSKKLPPGKGKEKADDEDEDDDDEALPEGSKELVICTLDLAKGYQQPLDIVINKHEQVLFKVSGSLSVHLTGNYLEDDSFDPDDDSMYDEEDEEYDLEPDDDELDIPYDEDESDELDDLENPRIEELDSDDGEAPKLIKSAKGKNKRLAEEPAEPTTANKQETLVNGDANLSKKQRKKLKANGGNAVDVVETVATNSDGSVKTHDVTKTSPGKKVQFAETLVQGPSGSTAKTDDNKKQDANGSKPEQNAKGNAPGLGLKTVQGVKIDDKKLGSGPQAKKGDKVSMRYIGKLEKDKRVFDSNKKGPPFSFKIASGQVIKGWDIGVSGMQAGGERRITVPAHLAYGSKKTGDIPPNSTLIFDLKLLDIK